MSVAVLAEKKVALRVFLKAVVSADVMVVKKVVVMVSL